MTRRSRALTDKNVARILELASYRIAASASASATLLIALFATVFALDAFCPQPMALSTLYALPVFLVSLRFGERVLVLALTAAFALSFIRLTFTGLPSDPAVLWWTSAIAGMLVSLSAAGGRLIRQRLAVRCPGTARIDKREIQRFMDVTLDCVCIAGLDGLFRQVNNALVEYVGRSAEQLIGTPFIDFIHEEDRDATTAAIARVARGSDVQSLCVRVRRGDGVYRWFDWNCPAMRFGEDVFYAAGRDVTEREHSEENVRRLAAIVDSSEDGIIGISLEGQVTSWNPGAERIFGFTAKDAIGRSIEIIIPSDRRAQFAEVLELIRAGEHVRQLESRGQRMDGQQLDLSLTVSLIRGGPGEVVGASISARDISDEKRYQRALIEMQARLERAVRGTYDGLWDWNVLTDHVWFAPRFRELLGFSPDDDFPERFSTVEKRLHPEDRQATLAALRTHLDRDDVFDVECRLQTKDGDWKWFRMRGASVRVRDNVPIRMSGSIQDITERLAAEQKLREHEERLRHVQRMEAVGQLAGGVAHEYNNLLQAIAGFTRFAQQSLPVDSLAHQDLEQALVATDRAAILTRQLLKFSKRDKIRPLPLKVSHMMSELAAILRPSIPASIDLQFDVRDEDLQVHADPNLLQQALMNLCVNARDAMGTSGKLQVRTQRTVVEEGHATAHPDERPGEYIQICITDTGCGIPDELQPRIFEPFFTTKKPGQGTGMGLAMVFGLVQQHGGFVRVASKLREGTTISVHLPLYQHAGLHSEQSAPNPPAPGGDELILVAEDDGLVREVLVRILQDAGYRTLTAEDGEQAVEQFSAHADEIDLLLFDVVMPNMGGKSAAAMIRLVRPDIPVGFCTGYDPAAATDDAAIEGAFLVEKPFKRNDLLSTLRRALDPLGTSRAVSPIASPVALLPNAELVETPQRPPAS